VAQGKFVAYYRVSTDRQGASGLGLEAQQASVRQFLNGGTWTLLDEFVEIESGKRIKRPQLSAALEVCKKRKATLVIAKLDRLARNVHFISGLMESGVEFVAADNPAANKLMIHMLAAFAEHEREMISTRTRQALAAARERGVVLGGPNVAALNAQKEAAADAFAKSIAPTIDEIRRLRIKTVRGVAEELNRRGVASPRGARWHLRSVHQLLRRLSRGSADVGEPANLGDAGDAPEPV
jgi:DNA invertase Pin-like site-specific DNA recombinase